MTSETVVYLIPELVLIGVATLIYMLGAFLGSQSPKTCRICTAVAVVGLAVAAGFLCCPDRAQPETGPLSPGVFGDYVRWLSLGVALLMVMLTGRSTPGTLVPEYQGTLLMAIAGTMIVATASDLVLLFLGLELVSIPTYVLLYIGRRDAASQESAVKYFFLSILSSAVLLYGFSFLYGISGSTDLGVLRETLKLSPAELGGGRLLALVALVLVFAGIGFRITAVPFHFYAPDVFQGTTNTNAGFLSVLPKIVGFAALVRIVSVSMPGLEGYGWRVALILSMLTMTLGNVLALWQDNLRRLLAYSSIAHAGYMLIGITVGFGMTGATQQSAAFDGIGAVFFYLAVYSVATLGTFAALTFLGTADRQVNDVDELAGLARTRPGVAMAIAVFMFSLAGIPPLAGFWGKLNLFSAALQNTVTMDVAASPPGVLALRNWLLALVIVGVLNAAIAAAYYLRIIAVMYFRPSIAVLKGQGGWGAGAATFVAALITIAIGLYPVKLIDESTKAGASVYDERAKPAADVQVAER